jgi:general nucleoside transport system ATP-binding protein
MPRGGARAAPRAPEPVIAATGLVKRFGTLTANDSVDLRVEAGEIHALLGENGAGKSTLVKMLYGLLQPDSGTIAWLGRPVSIPSPAAARRLGIGMVFQHFSLFESLTVAENVALALDGAQSVAAVAGRLAQVSRDYGLPLDPARRVDALSVGERQRIEIVRCLMQDPRLLILDEPTAVLTPQEAEQLFATLRRLAGEGRGILYITHRLEEVRRFCHRATILRHGKPAGLCDPRHETAASLARMMIGGDPGALQPGGGGAAATGADAGILLAANGLACDAADIHGVALHDVRLALRGGEILAIAGVAGNGQAELFALLSGERLAERAEAVEIAGVAVGRMGIAQRRRLGAAFVPEERLGHAAAPGMTLSENAALTGQGGSRHSAAWRFDRRAALSAVDAIVARFDVRKGRRDPEAGSLSGGNLQKFVVGREILRAPCVLIVNQPTWGVDAGAAATIRQALLDLARGGAAVLVISQDLDEVFQIADRVAVIHDGCLSQPLPAAEMTAERLGLLMGGAAGALAEA